KSGHSALSVVSKAHAEFQCCRASGPIPKSPLRLASESQSFPRVSGNSIAHTVNTGLGALDKAPQGSFHGCCCPFSSAPCPNAVGVQPRSYGVQRQFFLLQRFNRRLRPERTFADSGVAVK